MEHSFYSRLTEFDRKLIEKINSTEHRTEYFSLQRSLHEFALDNSDRVCIISKDKTFSYGDFDRIVCNAAGRILSKTKGRPIISVLLPKSPELIFAVSAVIYNSFAYVPLDYETITKQILFCIKDSGCSLLVTDREMFLRLISENGGQLPCDVIFSDELFDIGTDSFQIVEAQSNALFAVIYTSGSSGDPKGVMLEYGGIFNAFSALREIQSVNPDDRILAVSNICHDMAIYETVFFLFCGGSIVIPDPQKDKATEWLQLAVKHNITVWSSVPTMIKMLLFEAEAYGTQNMIPSLRLVQTGGEFVPVSFFKQLRTLSDNVKLCTVGGPTETSMINIFNFVTEEQADSGKLPYGIPIWNTKYYILDEKLRLVPPEEQGIIYNAGICISRGYTNKELTAEQYLLHPETGERLYRTGDIGSYNVNGWIDIFGRADRQIKIGGKRIELNGIETVLDENPLVRKSAVSYIQNQDGETEIIAYLKLNKSNKNTVEQWKEIFNGTYEQYSPRDNEMDFSGWKSSYTGEQIPDDEMKEWVDTTVCRISDIMGKNVLEIGCGTGLLLKQLAPLSEHYVATDLSDIVIMRLKNELSHKEYCNKVELYCSPADSLECVADRRFDTIIINSVIMFFQSVPYFTAVLKKCMELLKEEGTLFLGDIQDYELLNVFRGSVRMFRDKSGTIGDVKKQIEVDTANVKDLYVSQKFFSVLPYLIPEVGDICIHQKNMQSDNEISRFRYDVIIRKNKNNSSVSHEYEYNPFEGIKGITNILAGANRTVKISRIPNSRIWSCIAMYNKLYTAEETNKIADMMQTISEKEGALSPFMLYAAAKEIGLQCAVRNTDDGLMEAVFSKQNICNCEPLCSYIDPEMLVSHPVSDSDTDSILEQIRQYTLENLPPYMVPHCMREVEQIPLLPNKKVDYQRLKELEVNNHAFEETLQDIWCNTLGLQSFDITRSFYEAGGHSLLMIRLLNKIHRKYGVHIRFSEFAENPTFSFLNSRILDKNGSITNKAYDTGILHTSQDVFVMNDIQRSYYLGRSIPELSCATHIYFDIRVEQLDCTRFSDAVQKLIKRHDCLRCIITEDDNIHVLHDAPEYTVEFVDLKTTAIDNEERITSEIRDKLLYGERSLKKFPTFVLQVLVFSDCFIIQAVLDSVMIDGAGIAILENDLIMLYKGDTLPEIQLSLADYIKIVQERSKSSSYQASIDYWMSRKDTLPDCVPLRTKKSSGNHSPKVYRECEKLDAKSFSGLKQFAIQQNTSVAIVLLSVYAAVLAKWSNSRHFTINLPRFGKTDLPIDTSGLTGEFGALVFLEIDIRETSSVADILDRIQKQLYKDMEFCEVNGIDVLNRYSGNGRKLFLPIVFTYLTPSNGLKFIRDDYPIRDWCSQSSNVWIDAIAVEHGDSLQIAWDCFEGVLDNNMLHDMFNENMRLLNELSSGSLSAQGDIWKTISFPQYNHILALNQTEKILSDAPALLHYDFFQNVKNYPERIACITKKCILTYRDLYQYAVSVAEQLNERSASHPVMICMKRGWEQIAAVLGVLLSGRCYLPVSAYWPTERISYIIQTAGVSDVLVSAETEWKISSARTLLVSGNMKNGYTKSFTPVLDCDASSTAYIIYTSGTSGKPKGVVIPHSSAVNTIRDINSRFGLTAEDRVFSISELYFDLSVYDIFGMLSIGGAVYLPDTDEKNDVSIWKELCLRYKITVWNSVPALLEMLLNCEEECEVISTYIRIIMLSGDWIPLSLPERVFGKMPNAVLYSLGGATEASIWSNYFRVSEISSEWASIPYGYPLANQQMYVLDKDGALCPPGALGDIYIGGAGLADGYQGDPQLTGEKFVYFPDWKTRLYHTGDLGCYYYNGCIEFMGRSDFQVKINGYRIEPEEIEKIAVQYDSSVKVIVIGRDEQLLLYYAGPHDPDYEEGLYKYLKLYLPDYMIPHLIVHLDKIPMSNNGKVDRKALPLPKKKGRSAVRTTNLTADEAYIYKLFREMTGAEQFDLHESFWELGGNSLQGMYMINKLRKHFGIMITMAELYMKPTVSALTALVHEKGKITETDTGCICSAPLSYAQEGILSEIIEGKDYKYHIISYIDLNGVIDTERFRSAIENAGVIYDILKASIELDDQYEPFQIIHPERSLGVSFLDFSDDNTRIKEFEADLWKVRIDYEKEVLCKNYLVKFDESNYRWYIIIHHIIMDDISLRLFQNTVLREYESGAPVKPAIGVSEEGGRYLKKCIRERQNNIIPDEIKAYMHKIEENYSWLDLPDSKRCGIGNKNGQKYVLMISEDITSRFQLMCADKGFSTYTGYLSVYAVLLHLMTNETNISIGTPISARNAEETQTMGLLINMSLIQTVFSGNSLFHDIAGQINNQIVLYLSDNMIPYTNLIYRLHLSPELIKNVYHIVFNYLEKQDKKLKMSELKASAPEYLDRTVAHDFMLMIEHKESSCECVISYNTSYIDPSAAKNIGESFVKLLEQISESPDIELPELRKYITEAHSGVSTDDKSV